MMNSEKMKIAGLNLDSIRAKLMDRESGEGWSPQRASAVEIEYRRFLYLMKTFPSEVTSPFLDVDTFWHYHILDTQKYAADCEHVFGYFLHHEPSLSVPGIDEADTHLRAGNRMREIYALTFGRGGGDSVPDETALPGADANVDIKPAYCGVRSLQAAYCGAPRATMAYCGAAVAKLAYCGATSMQPAYCGATRATMAYCGASSARTANCGATVVKSPSEHWLPSNCVN